MIHEGQVAGGKGAERGRVSTPRVFEESHQAERSGVVVDAVAVLVTGDVEVGVLEEPRVVGHRAKVNQARLGQLGRAERESPRLKRAAKPPACCARARAKLAR